jgi:hypothetical protein
MAIPIATNLCLSSNVNVWLVMAAAALLPHDARMVRYSAEDRQSRG